MIAGLADKAKKAAVLPNSVQAVSRLVLGWVFGQSLPLAVFAVRQPAAQARPESADGQCWGTVGRDKAPACAAH